MPSIKDYANFEKTDVNEAYEFLCSLNLLEGMQLESWTEYCNWAYWNNPYRKNRPAGFLIKESGKIIAFISRIYVPFRIGTWEGIAALNDYTGVASKFRGFTGLTFISNILRDEDIAVTYSPHANNAIHLIWKKLGARFWNFSDENWIYRLSRFKSILCGYKILNRYFPNFLIHAIYKLECGLKKKHKQIIPRHTVNVTHKLDSSLNASINKLWVSTSTNINIGVMRNFDYLHWRYATYNNKNHYYLITRDANGKLAGLTIIYYDDKNSMAFIAEFLHNPTLENSAEQLLIATFNFSMKNLRCSAIATKIVTESLRDIWPQSGFKKAKKLHPQYGIMSKHLDSLTEEMNVMMTYGEYKI